MRAVAGFGVLIAAATALGCGETSPSGAFEMQRSLGRGINLGNVLEASPTEGSWGLRLSDGLFDRAKEAGFATIRLPVRWSNHAGATAPFTIDPAWFRRVDVAVRAASARDMNVVIDMHHYRQLGGEPLDYGERAVSPDVVDDRFVAMWAQIAERYRAESNDRVLFELYNEPNTTLTPERWNRLFPRALAAVRTTNVDRYVVIGPTSWNSADALKDLVLPDDPRIIVTVHNYAPFSFTHQGTGPPGGEPRSWLGTTCCTDAQLREITTPLDTAKAWAGSRWPIWLGEFGSYEQAPFDSRVRFTRIAREEAEKRGFTWAYWELASSFGIWDPKAHHWRTELRDALIGAKP